jgi:hypothetical protein
MKVKNIILYIVGILCCIGALALFVWGGFVPERQTATLLLVFLLGLTAVAVMDLIDEPEVIFLISHRRLRKGIEKDKLLPGKYWCKKDKKYIGAIVDLRGDVYLKSFSSKDKMKEWLGRSGIDNVNSSST